MVMFGLDSSSYSYRDQQGWSWVSIDGDVGSQPALVKRKTYHSGLSDGAIAGIVIR